MGIFIGQLPQNCLSFDVAFDNHRVWTVELLESPHPTDTHLEWPSVLTPYLVGQTTVAVIDSATGVEYFRGDIQFSADSTRTRVTNNQGIPLTINKWGDLAPAFTGLAPEVLEQLLDSIEKLVKVLRDLNVRPFVVGGTLLGAVREGSLLPHDDDADIAFLSHHTNPIDVATESLALGHKLKTLGYDIVRHSGAHMQLIFRDSFELPIYHIDIFSAFFTDDGHINQPFHVRGPFRHDQMLPFGSVTINGREFPTPADTEAWLTLNYDENWRTPIPGYRLVTPEATVRRFENWFGGFNFRREFWDHWFDEDQLNSEVWASGNEWLASQKLECSTIIELGSGNGALSERLAIERPTTRVIGTDYSASALMSAREARNVSNLEFRHSNLNRLESLGIAADVAISGGFDIVANHVLDQTGHYARHNALRLIRMSLRSGGRAYATSYGMHTADASIEDPTTWHLTQETLRSEAIQFGLDTDFASIPCPTDEASRLPYGVKFSISPLQSTTHSNATKRKFMMKRFRALIQRSADGALKTEVNQLKTQVRALEEDLDEYRRQSLRVAEVLDLVEQRLTSQSPAGSTE